MKAPALVATPPGATTLIGPLMAASGTVADSRVADTTENVAGMPPNVTVVAADRLAPLMVTIAPATPALGVKPEMLGGTVNGVELVAVPTGVVTVMGPVVALVGTVTEMEVPEVTTNVAAVPLNLTALAPVKLTPEIVTVVPGSPRTGVKPVIAGAWVTVNALPLADVPAAVVTAIGPLVAPAGTVATTWLGEFSAKFAD